MQQAIIIVSFGTKDPEQKKKYIDPCYHAIEAAYPQWQVFESFSSNFLRKRLREEAGMNILSPEDILKALKQAGCQRVIIQPLLMTAGREFKKLVRLKLSYLPFMHISLGQPMLSKAEDYEKIVQELKEKYQDEESGLLLIGQGSNDEAKEVYRRLQNTLNRVMPGAYVITIDEREDINKLRFHSKKIRIIPLSMAAGTHIIKDLLEDSKAQWRRPLIEEGYEILMQHDGMGQLESVKNIFIEHIACQL